MTRNRFKTVDELAALDGDALAYLCTSRPVLNEFVAGMQSVFPDYQAPYVIFTDELPPDEAAQRSWGIPR